MSKSANGADIPDKAEFVRNIGLGSAAKKDIVSDPLFNSDQPVALQSFADFRRIVSWAIPGNYPLGISAGIAAGEQVKKPQYNYVSLLNIRGWPDDSGVTACSRWFITPDGNAGISYTHHYGQDDAHYYVNVDLRGTRNTTVDNNGYLKKASPIIEIHPDGSFTTNDESAGATVERLSEGVYLIKNVLGFNADAAWGGVDGGIEIPLCKNKLPLIWVDYRVLPDGSIKLMTYHREHAGAPAFARNAREGYADGDPIDIPGGRYISARVQMPENSIWNQKQKLAESE
ncbi:hypothetical protein Xkoz_00134 [Xenorhabdus kozodoii]|uniref:Phage tail protein C-terminal domain-containing protein n=1 Tax=Xenorhabdus kozodoii TaxID=351676 RepID=A0A2D0LHN7_9GAMM|nr:hypothetical protein Xkoz_00134 [Xenorhabdus kozodoii]